MQALLIVAIILFVLTLVALVWMQQHQCAKPSPSPPPSPSVPPSPPTVNPEVQEIRQGLSSLYNNLEILKNNVIASVASVASQQSVPSPSRSYPTYDTVPYNYVPQSLLPDPYAASFVYPYSAGYNWLSGVVPGPFYGTPYGAPYGQFGGGNSVEVKNINNNISSPKKVVASQPQPQPARFGLSPSSVRQPSSPIRGRPRTPPRVRKA